MIDLGSKWFKCDLHLHTTASVCFKDRTVTAEDWVKECINKKLDCVAVTDHNTAAGISEIQAEAEKYGLHIFPGVEITCDSSKVHILVLFEIGTDYKIIEDFLTKSEISRDTFGQQEAFTVKTIFEIAEIAKRSGALVIPAHVDEYNGLGKIGNAQLNKFLELENINAVQVVHKQFFEHNKDKEEIASYLSEYYPLIKSQPRSFGEETIKNWYRPVRLALEKGLSVLTFSDNPHEKRNPKHGLWGIGERYTWIKMDVNPSLEGLRQAFIIPKFRIINDFECEANTNPNKKPNISINALTLKDTRLNKSNEEFTIKFHHQLNTIIGTPGSGKSSILKCIRGVLKNTKDLEQLNSILTDHDDFYKKTDRLQKGIFTDKSILKLSISKDNIEYEVIANHISNTEKQDIQVYRIYDEDERELQPIETLSFLSTEHYSQKQIFEIAQEPNSLRERIDSAIENMGDKKDELERLKSLFLRQSAEIREVYSKIYNKEKLIAEINEIRNQISALDRSGIEILSKAKESYEIQLSYIEEFKQQVENEINTLDNFANRFGITNNIELEIFGEDDTNEIKSGSDNVIETFEEVQRQLVELKNKLNLSYSSFKEYIDNSNWLKGFKSNSLELDNQKQKLKDEGVEDLTQFNRLAKRKAQKEAELREIQKIEKDLEEMNLAKQKTQELYFEKASEISSARKRFLDKVLQGKNVQIKVNKFRDKLSFEKQVRKIIRREIGFENDIQELINECFKGGRIEDNLEEFREKVRKVRNEDRVEGVRKYLNNLFDRLENVQIDELQILVPEDEITIMYKPKNGKKFLPLSNASAGQKTTAILTFLLSFGDYPLILDQPEDDLNGKLVYDLIVDRLQEAKGNRQMIIVTHNANIPVNADAELITCLSASTSKLGISLQGTVDMPKIKKEICDIMEGSVDAFDMRAKRYSTLKK